MNPSTGQRLMDVGFLLTVLFLTMIALKAVAADPDHSVVDRGRMIVSERCGLCHATGQTGNSPRPEAPPLRKLAERFPGPALAQALNMGMLENHPGMPTFRFNTDDLAAIVAYLQSIQEIRGA